MLKVAKFGGSSLANSTQFRKVRSIVESDPSRRYVVVSACGKESKEDHKVTDLLYLCEAHIRYGVPYDDIFRLIEDKYLKIRDDLGLTTDLGSQFLDIRQALDRGATTDYVVSRGEYLAALLMAEYLGATFVDAKDVIYFKADGSFDLPKIREQLAPGRVAPHPSSSPGFTVPCLTAASGSCPEEEATSREPSSPTRRTPKSMRTGPTFPASWWRTPGS